MTTTSNRQGPTVTEKEDGLLFTGSDGETRYLSFWEAILFRLGWTDADRIEEATREC